MSRSATAALEVDSPGLPAATLWGLLLSTALVPLGSTMVAVALTPIGRELGEDPGALTQWLVNSYLLVGIVLQSPAGKLGDLWGTRRVLRLGQLLFAAGAGLGFVGGSLTALVAARVVMGAGGALLVPAAVAVLRNRTALSRRARIFGVFGASMALAAALGPLVGGMLVEAFGWRSIFLANLPVLAVAAPLVHGLVGAAPERRAPVRFDWLGAGLLGAGLTSMVAAAKAATAQALGLLTLGLVLLTALVFWERRAEDPVLDTALFARTAFAAGSALVALHSLVMYGLIFQLPIWFATVMGSGSAETGRVLLAMMLSMVVCSPLGGRASERFGARAVALLGTVSALGGLLLLTRLGPLAEPVGAVPALILIGGGLGLAAAPIQSAAISAIGREQSGMAAGAISTMRYLGGVLGIGALGFILRDVALVNGGLALSAHLTAVWLYCAVMALATVPAALLPPAPPGGTEDPLPGTV